MSVVLNSDLCIQCEKCIPECPSAIFVKNESVAVDAQKAPTCFNCGHCAAVCPQRAITVADTAPGDLMPIAADPISEHQRHMLFKGRRSVRQFQKKALPAQLFYDILEDVRYAPTARNSRKVGWLLVNDAQKVHQLAANVAKHMAAAPQPYATVAQIFAGGKDVILRGAPCLILAHAPESYEWAGVDCAIACTYAELSLHSRGLGSCWAGFLIRIAGQHDIGLNLPEGHKVYAGLMVGYPAVHYASLPPRSELDIRWQ